MFKDFLNFNNNEQRAIIVIVLLGLCSLLTLYVIDYVNVNDSNDQHIEEGQVKDEGAKQEAKEFDPNTVDSLTLVGYGLDKKKIRNLLNYRRHGGKFRSAEDLQKLYNWTVEDYEKVKDYCKITNTVAEQKKKEDSNKSNKPEYKERESNRIVADKKSERKYPEKFTEKTTVDANTADTTLLKKIPGIGRVIAGRIVRYRDRLGGYVRAEQLLECEGVTPEMLDWITVKTDTKAIHTLNINTASFVELLKHPYIDKNQARDIVSYIRLYGNIKDMETLKRTEIFSDEEIQKLQGYLVF